MEFPNKLLLDIYESAQHCMPAEFNEFALNKFKKFVHFDSAAIVDFTVTHEREFVAHAVHLHSVPKERILDRPKTIGAESVGANGTLNSRDSILSKAFTQRGKSITVDVERTFSDPDLLNYCRKYETVHSLAFVSDRALNGMVPTIGFWRADRKNAYTEEHSHAATLVLPYVFQAREINYRLAKNVAPPAISGTTTMLASLEGCLYFVEPEAIRLLQLEWRQWTPPQLPDSLVESLRQSKEKIYVGAAISVKASVQGNMICLVVTARTLDTFRLTTAEYRVARLAADGLQYKEIARQLGVSPATVRNQLHAVYKKLGVTNKTALAAALSS